MIRRLKTRDTNDFGKDDSVHDTLIEWREKFDSIMKKAGAIPIDAEQPLDAVVEELISKI